MKMSIIKRESIPWYFDEFCRRIDYLFSSGISKLILKWWKVEYGKNLETRGRLIIKKFPYSSIKIGNNCRFLNRHNSNHIGINRPCIFSTQMKNASIMIGNNCGFSGTILGAFNKIELRDNVRCGANTLITDSDWHTDDPRSGISKPVLIQENVWLGEGVKILKGVTIGENSVIGAGSVVVKSIPNNVIAAGNPCRVIKTVVDPRGWTTGRP